MNMIKELEDELIAKQEKVSFFKTLIDPRKALKEAKSKGPVLTMVDYDEVQSLSQICVDLHIRHLKEANHNQP